MALEPAEEAVYNSLLQATTVESKFGRVEAIPIGGGRINWNRRSLEQECWAPIAALMAPNRDLNTKHILSAMNNIRLAAGLLVCLARLQSGEQAGVSFTGTVQFATSKRNDAQKRPFAGASVRLCSLERVIETQTDQAGVFRFVDVPPDTYDVMAAGKAWMPRVLKGIELKRTQREPVEIDMVMGDWQGMPACFRYDAQDCSPTKFYVGYDAPARQKSGMVLGVVTVSSTKGRSKAIPAAKVTLFRVGDKQPLAVKVTDKKGQFDFEIQPGIYELAEQ
jgi:hypothetical protein